MLHVIVLSTWQDNLQMLSTEIAAKFVTKFLRD